MPEDKDLKRAVRKRMGETGERYTKAREALRPDETRIASGERLRGVLEFPDDRRVGRLLISNRERRSARQPDARGRVEIAEGEQVVLVVQKPVELVMPTREELNMRPELFGDVLEDYFARHASAPEPDLAYLDEIDPGLVDHLAFEAVGTARDVPRVTRLRALKWLDLRHMQEFSDGDFEPLKAMTWLERLAILNTGTTDGLLRHLPLDSLQRLELPRCGITDEGAREIARHTNLRCINLAETRITDDGAQALLAMPHLEELQLAGTAITDAMVRAVAERTPPLAHVGFEDCRQVTEAAVASLRAVQPDLGLLPPFTSRFSPNRRGDETQSTP